MKYPFLLDLNLGSEEISKISRYLDSVNAGSSTVLRSAIGNDLEAEQILSGWDAIFNLHSTRMNETLLATERSNRLKYGPRSIASPWDKRSSGVYDYFQSSGHNHSVPHVDNASSPRRLRPINLDTSISYLKGNTNSGLPFITRKSEVKEVLYDSFFKLLDRKDPCILFTRTQEGNKTRNVWGYPVADTLNEMRFYRPLLDYQRKLSWRNALNSPDSVDRNITRIINSTSSDDLLVSIDFSAYDASISNKLQDCAFEYIENLFQNKYESELSIIYERFNTIGLITPDGVLRGQHGVPSGSTFTNEVDSIVQYLCARDFGILPEFMDIQGDDGVYKVKEPNLLFKHFESFGLIPNPDKSLISQNEVIYLQNLYSKDYSVNGIIRGIYPTYRALGRIIFPERYDQYSVDGIIGADYNSIRAISILENCSYHPLFEELVSYVASLDKFKLCFSQQGLSKYIKRTESTQGVDGIFNYRRGDSIKGLNSFKTVQVISKL